MHILFLTRYRYIAFTVFCRVPLNNFRTSDSAANPVTFVVTFSVWWP